MLRELSVKNLALIEDVRVELEPGFCAWTGETGAGKTLLLTALGLLLGQRGSVDLLRAGSDELCIVGRFELPDADIRSAIECQLGKPLEDGELILTRRLLRAGRSYAYLNEQPVSLATLRELGSRLVDVHGQRESLSLLEPAYQLQLLDAFGNLLHLRAEYETCADQVRSLRKRLTVLIADRQHRQRELALLRFEREELDAAQVQPEELTRLQKERERLAHLQALQSFAQVGAARLYDDEGSVFEVLGKLHRDGQGWAALDPGLEDAVHRLHGLKTEVQDVAETLRALGQCWLADPARRDQVEERHQLLRRLEHKYGRPVDELVEYRVSLDAREQHLQKQEDDRDAVERELQLAFAALHQAATVLGEHRRRVAKSLMTAVRRELADLGMPEAAVTADLQTQCPGDDPLSGELPVAGFEQLELMLAANRGEPPRALRKVASGGELSRTMLALKTVLASHDRVGTLVFDEIDANVGGRLGDVLGRKLSSLGQTHQVICVTHLPQVASFARCQWTIRKLRRGKRTATTMERVDGKDRLEELATMLRGESRCESTRLEASAMLAAARRTRA